MFIFCLITLKTFVLSIIYISEICTNFYVSLQFANTKFSNILIYKSEYSLHNYVCTAKRGESARIGECRGFSVRGRWEGGYLVVSSLVATPMQQPFFNSERAGLQRWVRELEVWLRRRARALRCLGRATTVG